MFIILLLVILIDLALVIFLISFLWTSIVGGVPYLVSDRDRIQTMIELSHPKKGDRMIDMGSGDGRVLIEFAKRGVVAEGYELNIGFVLLSRLKIWRAGYTNTVHVHWRNFLKADIKDADIIVVFGIPYVMEKLEKKLKNEAKKGTKIVCHSYPLPHMKAEKVVDHVYVYVIGEGHRAKSSLFRSVNYEL